MNAKQTQTSGKRGRSSTATAVVMDEKREPIGSDKESELRGGKHMSAVALAILWTNKELETAEQRRAVEYLSMLRASSDDEAKEALRGATKDEREADKNALPPAVAAMVERGMLLSSARVRLSQMRSIRDAYEDHALPIFDAKGEFVPSKVPGWNPLVKAASVAAQARKEKRASIRQTNAEKKILDDIAASKGGYAKLTPEEFEQAQAELADRLQAAAVETEAEKQSKKADRIVEGIVAEGEDWGYTILSRLAAKLGYNLSRMTKAERKAQAALDEAKAELIVKEQQPDVVTH